MNKQKEKETKIEKRKEKKESRKKQKDVSKSRSKSPLPKHQPQSDSKREKHHNHGHSSKLKKHRSSHSNNKIHSTNNSSNQQNTNNTNISSSESHDKTTNKAGKKPTHDKKEKPTRSRSKNKEREWKRKKIVSPNASPSIGENEPKLPFPSNFTGGKHYYQNNNRFNNKYHNQNQFRNNVGLFPQAMPPNMLGMPVGSQMMPPFGGYPMHPMQNLMMNQQYMMQYQKQMMNNAIKMGQGQAMPGLIPTGMNMGFVGGEANANALLAANLNNMTLTGGIKVQPTGDINDKAKQPNSNEANKKLKKQSLLFKNMHKTVPENMRCFLDTWFNVEKVGEDEFIELCKKMMKEQIYENAKQQGNEKLAASIKKFLSYLKDAQKKNLLIVKDHKLEGSTSECQSQKTVDIESEFELQALIHQRDLQEIMKYIDCKNYKIGNIFAQLDNQMRAENENQKSVINQQHCLYDEIIQQLKLQQSDDKICLTRMSSQKQN